MKITNKQFIWSLLAVILSFSFLTRIWRVQIPPKYVFDEVYHVVTAKLIAKNDPRAFEWWHGPTEPNTAIDWLHPPFAKYTQAFFINLLGNNSFSWRISSVLFGVGVIWLTYILAQELFENSRLSLMATFLVAMDGLLLVQSRITMNDIHVTLFILLTFIFYKKYQKQRPDKKQTYLWLTGIAGGLAVGSKWSGVFAILIILLSEGLILLKKILTKKTSLNQVLDQIMKLSAAWIALPFALYILSYSQMFLQGHDWDHFKGLHQQIWWYQTNLDATHSYQSQPWQWFLNLRPVWFYVDYGTENKIANIYSFGNPLLQGLGALSAIWSLGWLLKIKITNLLHKKPKLTMQIQNISWIFMAYVFLWLPWQISPRIMFYYHYTPAVPLLVIILAYWLNSLWELKTPHNWTQKLVIGVLVSVGVIFGVWYPHWTAIPMQREFVNKVYFLLPGWK